MSTYLFIDGTNLYAAQYKLFGPIKYLDFSKLIAEVEKKLHISFSKIYFYASFSPKSKKSTQKERLFLKNEALFYRNVKQTKNVIFFTGYRSKTSGKEKEVDVKLTADLITFAFLNQFNTAYIFTGDADFLQALFNIKRFCKRKIFLSIICMENKIMHKGAFYFNTNIIAFNKLIMQFHPKQKIKISYLDKSNLTSQI